MEEDLFECAACAPNVQSMRAHREWLAAKVNDQGEEIERLKGALAASELVRGQMTSRALAYEAGLRKIANQPVGCPPNCECEVAVARRTLQATEWPPPSATAAPEVEVCVGCGKPWPCEHAAVKGHLDAAPAGFDSWQTGRPSHAAPTEEPADIGHTDRCGCSAAPAADYCRGRKMGADAVSRPCVLPRNHKGECATAAPAEEEKCPVCEGDGEFTVSGPAGIVSGGSCPKCHGTGRAPSRGEVG